MAFNTLSVHAGAQPDPATGARATPIYQTTAFVFEDADHAAALFNLQVFGNIYSRIMNPDQCGARRTHCGARRRPRGLAVASGHAAQLIALHTLMEPGDEYRFGAPALWRLDQPVQPGLCEVRLACEMGRRDEPGLFPAAITPKPKRSSSKASPIPAASSPTSKRSPALPKKPACR
jgi:hypothetical protein